MAKTAVIGPSMVARGADATSCDGRSPAQGSSRSFFEEAR